MLIVFMWIITIRITITRHVLQIILIILIVWYLITLDKFSYLSSLAKRDVIFNNLIKFYSSTPSPFNFYINSSFNSITVIKNVFNNHLTNKSLIPWGIILSSTVGIKFTQIELNMIKLPYFLKSVITGILLSDGSIVFGNVMLRNK